MNPQQILTAAVSAIQADRSVATASRVIYIEMLFAAKRHLRDSRLAELLRK